MLKICRCRYLKDRGFNSFACDTIKLSVNETKWSSLLARTRALILYILIWIFDFGPVKLPGLSRNGPQVWACSLFLKRVETQICRQEYKQFDPLLLWSLDCEKSLFFFTFSESNARARERRSRGTRETRASPAISHAGGHLRVLRFARRTSEKRETCCS